MGSLSLSGGNSRVPDDCEDLRGAMRPFVLVSGELALLTRGFRATAFLGAAVGAGVAFEVVRVARAGAAEGAGIVAAAFVRVDERVDGARVLLAILRVAIARSQ